jgi:Ca-activated chloride channel homolog
VEQPRRCLPNLLACDGYMQEALSAFHFIRPQWLWLLIPAVLLYLVVLRREDVKKRWGRIIDPALLKELLIDRRLSKRFRPVHSVCLCLALAAIGMSGPSWSREKSPFTEDKAPLILALDLGREMDAIDVQPTRLERAKLKIADLLKRREGARTGLFAYAGSPHMVVPLTSDSELMQLYLQSLSTNLMPQGTKRTDLALSKIDKFLKSEEVPGTILFLTDGVEANAVAAFRKHHNESRHQTLVLGIGTAAGGPLKDSTGNFVTEGGRRVFSQLDVQSLKALKQDANIPTSTLTLDDDDIDWVQRRAASHLQDVQEHEAKVRWLDQGYWLVIPFALLLSLSFRKGWNIRWTSTAVLLAALCFPNHARASDFHFLDLWLTPDQQGRYYYEHGDFTAAARSFQDAQWKGMALAREGNYAGALEQFALSDSAEAWFNQGNALAQLKRYPEAVSAYREALKRRSNWREAEDNLRIIKALIPPPPPDEQQEEAPNLKPDEVKFDEKGKKGKKTKMNFGPEQMADTWMRNIQINPADFLRRKFAIENAVQTRGEGK